MEGKNIKVYGTLINQTQNTNSSMRDSQHNDLIAVAYQLYDERFNPRKGSGTSFAVTAIDRYQDIINKRLTAIYFDDKGTDNTSDDVTYIDSKLNVAGDSVFEGPVTFNNNVNITGNINLNIGLNDLNDVTLSTMAVGQVLRYDGSKWVNAKLSLSDIQMPAASNGQVLKFNGTEWVAAADDKGTTINSLNDLSDVDTTGKTNGQALVYDSQSGKWKPGDVQGGGDGTYNIFGRNVVYKQYPITLRKAAYRIYAAGGSDAALYNGPLKTNLKSVYRPGDNYMYVYVSDSAVSYNTKENFVSYSIPLNSFQNIPYVRTFAEDYSLIQLPAGDRCKNVIDGTPQTIDYALSEDFRYYTASVLQQTSSVKSYYKSGPSIQINDGGTTTAPGDNLYLYTSTNTVVVGCRESSSEYTNPQTRGYNAFVNGIDVQYVPGTGSNSPTTVHWGEVSGYAGGEYYTTISNEQFLNDKKWNTGNIFVTVPLNHAYTTMICATDYSMPDTIQGILTTYTIVDDNSEDFETLEADASGVYQNTTPYYTMDVNTANRVYSAQAIFTSSGGKLTKDCVYTTIEGLEVPTNAWSAIIRDEDVGEGTTKFRFLLKKQNV